ncbi:conserved hypothetical protein [Acidovorax delafieldii 2AN]|uniref:Uncharacterized protein n=1 Tax=Acidovorax delafieldii 2AN TaxID=573060 RepID=C5T016_ACIDE|nr:hypothetical protein [Acidovorax delafieldii]EER62124.1 conserved hypothetical protein [Acidovorax delafieldii 2AN]
MLHHSFAPEIFSVPPVCAPLGDPPLSPPFMGALLHRLQAGDAPPAPSLSTLASLDADEGQPIEWSEEDVVLLHWRLLKEIGRLADPETPLEEKFDTLRWVFTERDKDLRPFSFVSCLRVVACSPLSPLPYCGLVDAEEVRDFIRLAIPQWLHQTLLRYPVWVREAIVDHPDWVEARLARNPQWINEEVRRVSLEGDLFACPSP